MGWSDWPSWVKGGVIFSILILLFYYLPIICLSADICINISTYLLVRLPLISSLFNLILSLPNLGSGFIVGIYTFIFFFAFGAIVGKGWSILSGDTKKLLFKGAGISLIIGFLLNIIMYFSRSIFGGLMLRLPNDAFRIFFAEKLFPIYYIMSGNILLSDQAYLEIIFYIINSAIIYIIIGALIGWIVGKFSGDKQ